MVKRNPNIAKLHAGYLFPEIHKRKVAYLQKFPDAHLISLGIGDTTEPIPSYIAKKMELKAEELATPNGYSGYGPEQGAPILRQKIAEVIYKGERLPEEIFISDGSKCDIGRFQLMFGSQCIVAVQDPTYPAYVDTSVVVGQAGLYEMNTSHYKNIVYMRCSPENDFFPDLDSLPRADLIYFCSPNNPTGAAATKEQLQQLVRFAKMNKSIILYDAAYADYIRDKKYPKTIYEIPGADEVSIEMGSFSKMAGFTGVRLGWTVVPEKVCFDDGTQVRKDWQRIHTTFFNGASNIAQAGGIAVLENEGQKAIHEQIDFYLENAKLLRNAFTEIGFTVYGGIHAPYLWIYFPGRKSWDMFEELLNEVQIVTTPGIGFGPGGEGFLRLSAYGHRENIEEAIQRMQTFFAKSSK